MSVPDEKADAAIRGLLSRYPRPALGSDFSSGVLRRVSEHEREGVRQRHVAARLLLGAYWLAATLASVWILARLPWPEWAAPVAWGVALVVSPIGYAVALFPERARASACPRPPAAPAAARALADAQREAEAMFVAAAFGCGGTGSRTRGRCGCASRPSPSPRAPGRPRACSRARAGMPRSARWSCPCPTPLAWRAGRRVPSRDRCEAAPPTPGAPPSGAALRWTRAGWFRACSRTAGPGPRTPRAGGRRPRPRGGRRSRFRSPRAAHARSRSGSVRRGRRRRPSRGPPRGPLPLRPPTAASRPTWDTPGRPRAPAPRAAGSGCRGCAPAGPARARHRRPGRARREAAPCPAS